MLPGETAAYTLSVGAAEGFAAPVTLTLQGAPSGAIILFDPNLVAPPGTSQLYITTSVSTLPGTYLMSATGTSGQVTSTASLTLTISPVLTVTAQPRLRTMLPGETTAYTLAVAASEGFVAPVTLTLQSAPLGATVSLDPNPVTPPGTSQLTITTSVSAVPGTYVMTVTGTSGQVTATTSLTLTVSPALTLTAQPSLRTILPGETATYTLSVDAAEGFAAPVTLTSEGTPSGANVSFVPNPVAPPDTSQMTITTIVPTTLGTYVMTVTGTSGQVTATTSLTLLVTSAPPPTFTMSVSPTTRIARPSQAVSYTAFITKLNDFSQPVSLTVVGLPIGVDPAWSVNPVTPDGSSMLTLFIPSNPPFGEHQLQVVGTADTQVVTKDFGLTIAYFETYLPIALRGYSFAYGEVYLPLVLRGIH
jgi:hypothetical protein